MSRLDSSVQKATKNILHSLYESALSPVTEASGASTQQQINRDKPEDAPKETKDALIKKVQNDKIPAKSLKEGQDDYYRLTDEAVNGEKVYVRQDGDPMVVQYADNYPEPEEYDEAYLVQNGNSQASYDEVKKASEDGNVWVVSRVSEDGQTTGEVVTYLYGEANLYTFFSRRDIREVKLVTRLEESAECKDKSLKEGIEDALKQAEDQLAELQDYLDNTPEIADDEKESIQNEINELLDQIEYYRNEMSFTDNAISESSLTEAPNPENTDINKKILNTIRTKRDTEPKYKSDLEAAGLTKDVAQTAKDEEPGSWSNRNNIRSVETAKAKYDSFMSTISDKIKELQDNIKNAEKYRDEDLKRGEEAEKRRQEILNNARAKRNKGGNV